MELHVVWGRRAEGSPHLVSSYERVTDPSGLDVLLEAITKTGWLASTPALVMIGYDGESGGPATQLQVLLGHPGRSALLWSSGDGVRAYAADPAISRLAAPITCDDWDRQRAIAPEHTQITPALARIAAGEYACAPDRLPSAPRWIPFDNPLRSSTVDSRMGLWQHKR